MQRKKQPSNNKEARGGLGKKFSLASVLAAGGLVLAACGGSQETVAHPTPIETTPTSPSVVTPKQEGVKLTFDALGAKSKVVAVYAGAKAVAADREPSGTYYDGDSVQVECKVEGRKVQSDVAGGEKDRASNKWVRIESDTPQYATAVYIEDPAALLGQLPKCQD